MPRHCIEYVGKIQLVFRILLNTTTSNLLSLHIIHIRHNLTPFKRVCDELYIRESELGAI
jgi:hypothetical protein